MATFPVDVIVGYLDSAERTAEITYRLRLQYDDVAANFALVQAAAADLETALNVLTWDHIDYIKVAVITGGGGAAANVSANNQVRAFHRVTDANGVLTSFEVPSWDDFTFDQDSNHLLSPAYLAFAQDVADLIANPGNGANMTTVNWAQSRTRKSRSAIR